MATIAFNLTCIFSFPFFNWQFLAVLLFPWQYAKGQGSDASQFGSLENVPLTDKWWYIKTRIIEILEAQLCTSKFHCIAASSLVCLLEVIMVQQERFSKKICLTISPENIVHVHLGSLLNFTFLLKIFKNNFLIKQYCYPGLECFSSTVLSKCYTVLLIRNILHKRSLYPVGILPIYI